jgi:DNA-binding Lrp family transcriptional regulator
MTESGVIAAAASLLERGAIRKIGAILRRRQAGFTENIMVSWAVPCAKVEEVGGLFSAFSGITPCYERPSSFLNRYNPFTTAHLHGKEDESLLNEDVRAIRHLRFHCPAGHRRIQEKKHGVFPT